MPPPQSAGLASRSVGSDGFSPTGSRIKARQHAEYPRPAIVSWRFEERMKVSIHSMTAHAREKSCSSIHPPTCHGHVNPMVNCHMFVAPDRFG